MGKRTRNAGKVNEQRLTTGPFRSTITLTFLSIIVAIFAYAFYNCFSIGMHFDWSYSSPASIQVERYVMNNSISYRAIAELHQPCILLGSVADRWRARKEWSVSFLKAKIPHVMAYRQESERRFTTFHDNKPLEPLVNEKWEDFNVKVNTTLAAVLGKSSSPNDGPYLYYSENVEHLRRSVFTDIMDYLHPIDELILSKENIQINLWVGRQGIVTNTHYDTTYNFFVQLRGKKRFTLFKPSDPVYVYPCLHPHYGHSQVDITNPDHDKFPLYRKGTAYTAILSPGDMLSVPPFWFHHVETLEESVSVNIWSDSPEYSIINEIYSKPIPFEEEWGLHDRVFALRLYLTVLATVMINDAKNVLLKLKNQRYRLLVEAGNININQVLLSDLRKICSSEEIKTDLDQDLLIRKFKDSLKGIKHLFNALSKHDTRDLLFGNYIEHLLHAVLGIDYVYPFLSSCTLTK